MADETPPAIDVGKKEIDDLRKQLQESQSREMAMRRQLEVQQITIRTLAMLVPPA